MQKILELGLFGIEFGFGKWLLVSLAQEKLLGSLEFHSDIRSEMAVRGREVFLRTLLKKFIKLKILRIEFLKM